MKKEHKILIGAILATIVLTALVTSLIFVSNKNTNLTATLTVAQTNHPPAVSMTNAPASQVDLLAAEVKALKAANEERGARVKRLIALNEEVQRERAITVTVAPITINVTNSTPSVQLPVPTNKEATPEKKTKAPKTQAPKMRVPMYTITNSTSSVTVTGTNTVSQTNTVVQNYLYPPKRSVLGTIFGGPVAPIGTDTPSGNSVQQGYPPTPVVVVEQSYGYGYPYGYGGYRSPYQPVYSGYGSCERRLFGVRFHTR